MWVRRTVMPITESCGIDRLRSREERVGGGIGKAGRGAGADSLDAADGGADGGTQDAREAGADRFEITPEARLRAARRVGGVEHALL
jgi:hypothetical protein